MREIMTGIKREFAVDINDSIVSMIKKCWSVAPEDCPTFSDILDELQAIKYRIFDDVNVEEVREHIDEIQVD
jgi:hypothetical protein